MVSAPFLASISFMKYRSLRSVWQKFKASSSQNVYWSLMGPTEDLLRLESIMKTGVAATSFKCFIDSQPKLFSPDTISSLSNSFPISWKTNTSQKDYSFFAMICQGFPGGYCRRVGSFFAELAKEKSWRLSIFLYSFGSYLMILMTLEAGLYFRGLIVIFFMSGSGELFLLEPKWNFSAGNSQLALLIVADTFYFLPKFYQVSIDFISFLSSNFFMMLKILEGGILPLCNSSFLFSSPDCFKGTVGLLLLVSKMDFFFKMGGRPVTDARGSCLSFFYGKFSALFESMFQLSPLVTLIYWSVFSWI